MRYQNWDILLFPNASRVPVQEFDTKCHVLHNPRAKPAMGSVASDDPFLDKSESMSKVPILTCFVPSLAPGTPFRASIHSWVKPIGSAALRSCMAVVEKITFEARVYIDGVHHSSRTLQGDTVWPVVVETTDLPHHDSNGELRFPPFHPEILQQAHWDAGEQLGRIKIVVSEGVMRESSPLARTTFTFDRLRDVVAFSFQHAPQNILEYAGIAWPNARMFESIQRNPSRPGLIGTLCTSTNRYEAYVHSPQRSASEHVKNTTHNTRNSEASGYQTYQLRSHARAMRPLPSHSTAHGPTGALSSGEDPFMGPPSASHPWRSKVRSNSIDDAIPDYELTEVGHSRESTMSGVSWPRRDFQRHMDKAAVDEIIQALSPGTKDQLMEALSPMKSSSSGLQPPANTPRTIEASKQPSPVLKASNEVSSKEVKGFDPPFGRRRLNSGDSSANSSSELGQRSTPGGGRISSVFERVIVTRLQKSKEPITVKDLDARLAMKRGRSDSHSSRKKRSLSPASNAKTTPKITLRISPRSDSSDKENQQLTEDSGLEGVSITVE